MYEQYLKTIDLQAEEICALSDHVTAEILGVYSGDYYAGRPCLTRNAFGNGKAYYLAAKVEQAGLQALYAAISDELHLISALPDALPYGVTASRRGDTVFLQNFSGEARRVTLAGSYQDRLTGNPCTGSFDLPANGVLVLERQAFQEK